MDKYEYKVRAEEIKSLIEQRRYPEAMAIADTIDWRKVKSVSMLCDISDLYNVNRKFEVARDVLELAYERHPEGRRIVYSLCELSIKMEDVIHAVEYYKEFVKIAPRDSGRYILQYKIYQAQEVSIDECIVVLKELKKRDYREKWAYELAYLYHRAGLATECVEECDELILWFGEGTFVKKAMELKMLHTALTPAQKEKYDLMNGRALRKEEEAKKAEPEIRVKPVDTSIYNTMNLQKELAMSLEAVLKKDKELEEPIVAVHNTDTGAIRVDEIAGQPEPLKVIDLMDEGEDREPTPAPKEEMGDTRIFDPSDISRFSKLIPDAPAMPPPITAEPIVPMIQKEMHVGEVPISVAPQEKKIEPYVEPVQEVVEELEEEETTIFVEESAVPLMKPEVVTKPQPEAPSGFEELLSQEYDGQISLVVPEEETADRQITGQLSIEDVLAEWERMKKENEQKRQDEVRQKVLEHTGNIMKDMEEAVHEELETYDEVEASQEAEQETLAEHLEVPSEGMEEISFEDLMEDQPEEVQEVSDEIVEEVSEDILEEASQEALEEVVEEFSEDIFEEASQEALEEVVEDVSEDIFEEASQETLETAGEEIFEELEEILEPGELEEKEEPMDEQDEESHFATDLLAGAAVAGLTAAAGITAEAKAEETVMDVVADAAKEAVSVAGDVASGVVKVATDVVDAVTEPATEEPKKRTPYGANRFEYGEEESTLIEEPSTPKQNKRIVQDYNELLYGDEFSTEESVPEEKEVAEEVVEEVSEETAMEDVIAEDVTETAVSEESPEEPSADEEEGFDPQDFMSGMFEPEEAAQDSTESTPDVSDNQKEDSTEEAKADSAEGEMFSVDQLFGEAFDGDDTTGSELQETGSKEVSEEASEDEEYDDYGFDFEGATIEDEPEQVVDSNVSEEEESYIPEFNPETVEMSEDATAQDTSSEEAEPIVAENTETEEADATESSETSEASNEEESHEEEVKEDADDIAKRMEALASKVFNPAGVYVPHEEPLADTFVVVTHEMQEEMLHPHIPEQEPVVEEQIIAPGPIPVMPMVETSDVLQEALQTSTVDTFTANPYIQENVSEIQTTEEMKQPEMSGTEAGFGVAMDPQTQQNATEGGQTVLEEISSEDQYAKALEEQLSSVAPDSFTAIDENTFERVPQSTITDSFTTSGIQAGFPEVSSFTEEPEPQVENFYERQAEIERSRISRDFTETEERLYGSFLRTKKAKEQLIYAIDNISMASYTGNIIITGDDQKENLELARNLLKEVQQNDDNFSGVPGKISADSLNRKEVESILQKVENGAVIIENAGGLSKETVEDMTAYLEKENRGIIVILIDHKMNMDKMLSNNPALRSNFNARIDIEEMTSQELTTYGKSYAYEKEYAIDEMGMLALFTRIDELQTMGHIVMPEEVEKIVDGAIKKANRKNVRHFTDILLNKRYDDEDMIVLREKDF